MERENKEYERGSVITQHDYKDEALYTREMFASVRGRCHQHMTSSLLHVLHLSSFFSLSLSDIVYCYSFMFSYYYSFQNKLECDIHAHVFLSLTASIYECELFGHVK